MTSRERFTAVLGGRPRRGFCSRRARRASGWPGTSRALGHEVIVADPNFAAMYATRSRRVKTDQRDARTLCEALPARRLSTGASAVGCAAARARRAGGARSARADADAVHRDRESVRAPRWAARGEQRVAPGGAAGGGARAVARRCAEELAPLFARARAAQRADRGGGRRIAALTATDPAVALLATAPSIGPITASGDRRDDR